MSSVSGDRPWRFVCSCSLSISIYIALEDRVNEKRIARPNCGLFVSDPHLSRGRSALKCLQSPLLVSLNTHQDSKHRPARPPPPPFKKKKKTWQGNGLWMGKWVRDYEYMPPFTHTLCLWYLVNFDLNWVWAVYFSSFEKKHTLSAHKQNLMWPVSGSEPP